MLFLLDANAKTVKWNGIPLHEASSAIVKEETNGDFYLTVRYPITDSGIYQLIKEDMLIKAPVPVLSAQLFRIKKPIENDDSLNITAYHISDDIMRRSIKPISVVQLGCAMALSQMVQNAKTDLGDFSFTSDISDNRTFNTTETETLYTVLMDGKHSIVGTWEGELVRDNFALSIKRSRGADRGVIITTHKNLKSYQRTKNSQNVVTRLHARSTFKPEGAEDEVTLKVTVDSPLINSYPYINEKEYENNNAKTIDDLRKWAEAKFKNDGIDKVSDAIKIEAYELDGQVVHLGDTVNLKSRKHSADLYKKAIAYEFNALTEEYISITFDDKPEVGGSGMSSGLSNAADAILGASATAQNVAIERALKNADAAFDAEFNKRSEAIKDDIEKIKARAEANKAAMTEQLNLKINQSKSEVTEQLKSDFDRKLATAQNDLAGVRVNLTQAQSQLSDSISQIRSDVGAIRTKQSQAESEIAKQVSALNQTKTELAGVKSAQANYEQTTTRRLAELTNLADGKASRSEVAQTAEELASRIASVHLGRRNLLKLTRTLALNEEKPWNTADSYDGFVIARSVAKDKFTDTVKLRTSEPPKGTEYVLIFYARASRDDYPIRTHFYSPNTTLSVETSTGYKRTRSGDGEAKLIINREWKRYWVKYTQTATDEVKRVFIGRHGSIIDGGDSTTAVEICAPALFEGNMIGDWSPAYEDQDERLTAAESSFKQRADSIEASVSSLREGLKTKADSSALSLLSDSIKQSVKSLETDTQNKLDSKLSTAVFEVRASGIRQEILNAAKDKADKTLVVTEAGKIREELASLRVGGVNLLKRTKAFDRVNGQSRLLSETYNNCAVRYFKNADANSAYQDIVEYKNALYPDLGGTYTLSFWAKGTGEMTTFFYGQRGFLSVLSGTTSQGFVSKSGDGNCRFTLSPDWQRYYVVYKLADTPAEATSIYKHVLFRHNSRSTTDEVWLAGVKLERGNLATDYSENPEDVEGLITEAKATFERTAQGLRVDLAAVQSYVNSDSTRAEALRSYSREETARQLTAVRQLVESGYVAKAQHTEDVRGLTRRFEELKTSSDTKFAQFKQGIDGQFATISSQIGESLKKTDISITPGQIILGTGKVVNGQALASLFVQNPQSIEAITKLMKITGDLIVDGSITGRDFAAGAITTPHLAAGAVTAEELGANAVTADKVKADDALLEKLSAGEALLRKLMAKDAFVNTLQSIDFTANQIRGGVLGSIDGTLNFDLNKNTLIMGSNTAAIKRVLPGHPTQFMRYETERKGNVDYTRTIIGSNRNGSEKFDSVTFAGLVVENSNKAGIEDSLRLYGDNTYFRHAQGEVGWNINAVTQRMSPATWQKESAVWSRSFVVPKHRTPNGRDWVKLEETVAALWRLWEHAAGNQVTMTGAMRDKVRELFQNYGYNYGIS